MDNKITLNKNNNFNYDTLNQNILEQATLLKMTSEIRALNIGIIPKMDVVKKIHLIEPEWNEVRQNQICSRILESKICPILNLQGCKGAVSVTIYRREKHTCGFKSSPV